MAATSIFDTVVNYSAAVTDKVDGDILYATGSDQRYNQHTESLRQINEAFNAASVVPAMDIAALTINSAYAFPAADGTSGYVLTTDGAGTVSWAAAATGGGYDTIANAGTPVAQETTIDLIGGEIVASPGASKTDVQLATVLLPHEFRDTSGTANSEATAATFSHKPTGPATGTGGGVNVKYQALNGSDALFDAAAFRAITTTITGGSEAAYVDVQAATGGSLVSVAEFFAGASYTSFVVNAAVVGTTPTGIIQAEYQSTTQPFFMAYTTGGAGAYKIFRTKRGSTEIDYRLNATDDFELWHSGTRIARQGAASGDFYTAWEITNTTISTANLALTKTGGAAAVNKYLTLGHSGGVKFTVDVDNNDYVVFTPASQKQVTFDIADVSTQTATNTGIRALLRNPTQAGTGAGQQENSPVFELEGSVYNGATVDSIGWAAQSYITTNGTVSADLIFTSQASHTHTERFRLLYTGGFQASAAAAANYPITSRKTNAASANDKHLQLLQNTSTQIFYIESDASGNVWQSTTGTLALILAIGGTYKLQISSTNILFNTTLNLQANQIQNTHTIYPNATETYDLGSTSRGWLAVRSRNYYGPGTGNASQIELGNSTDLYIKFTTSGTLAYSIDSSGILQNHISGNEQTSVGSAGGATALPSNPTGYLKIHDSGGTLRVIPYYDQA